MHPLSAKESRRLPPILELSVQPVRAHTENLQDQEDRVRFPGEFLELRGNPTCKETLLKATVFCAPFLVSGLAAGGKDADRGLWGNNPTGEDRHGGARLE